MQDVVIEERAHDAVPIELLLIADPSREKLASYLPRSVCCVALREGAHVGAYVVMQTKPETYELMSIAVPEALQGKGIGVLLLTHAIENVRARGARIFEVGTGTFGYPLTFYQRAGFRIASVDRDFFLDNYDEPLFEDGLQHKDMLRLEMIL